eukprot:TRINITY_DN3184_c0_g1_i11.p1 TRINITY_DN3184_c0_g1~~TRINITY_DN3184_c0_g1_i11.p1  ORF type:complete len:687 (-),score=99.61 TRINITY_DN3184_c0_g1_i11:1138-2958(-)
MSKDFLTYMQQDLNELETVEENTDNVQKQLLEKQGNIFGESQVQQRVLGNESPPPSPLLPFEVSSLFGSCENDSAHQPPLELGNVIDLETLISKSGLEANLQGRNLSGGHKSYQQRQRLVQEKNRRAQARFRDRQRSKVSELSSKLQDLNVKINSLSQENSNLQSKNSILEKVLSIREEQLLAALTTKREKFKNEGIITELPFEEETPPPLALCLLDDQQQNHDKIFLTVLNKNFYMQEIKNLSLEQLSNIWKAYVNELGVVLVNIDENERDAEYARMEQLVNEVTMLLTRYCTLNPVGVKKWVACSGNPQLFENHRQFQNNQSRMEECMHIVRSLKFTSQQISEIIYMREMLFENISKFSNKRKEINKSFQYSLPNSEGGPQISRRFVQAHESLGGLKKNLLLEHTMLVDFVGSMYRKVFQPIQFAKLLISAYPYPPDALLVAQCITQLPNDNMYMRNVDNNTSNNDVTVTAFSENDVQMHYGNQNKQTKVNDKVTNNNGQVQMQNLNGVSTSFQTSQFVTQNNYNGLNLNLNKTSQFIPHIDYYLNQNFGNQTNQFVTQNISGQNQNSSNGNINNNQIKSVVGVGRTVTTGVSQSCKFASRRRS